MVSLSAIEFAFIRDHLTDDVRTLLLRAHPASLDVKKLAAQILARQKACHKLPTWYAHGELVFPPTLSVEQASSEAAARYKASLVGGTRLVDLTGGMGVDAWAFAERFGHVQYVEQQPELAQRAAYNLPRLGATNVGVYTGNGLAFVTALSEPADWLYLDPHRRDQQGNRVVRLSDCEPDLSQPGVLPRLLAKTNRMLLKTSPLIDLEATIRQLASLESRVEAVHVVAVQGEVKEVLFILTAPSNLVAQVNINTVNLLLDRIIQFNFQPHEERNADVRFGDPQQYLYEPNAAVLKAGAFRIVAERFNLTKLAPNSHLYTNDDLRRDFPGRFFVLEHAIKPDRKALKAILPTMQANLTVRNFPQSVADLRKKLNLREGGDTYVFATTLLNDQKRLLIGHKID